MRPAIRRASSGGLLVVWTCGDNCSVARSASSKPQTARFARHDTLNLHGVYLGLRTTNNHRLHFTAPRASSAVRAGEHTQQRCNRINTTFGNPASGVSLRLLWYMARLHSSERMQATSQTPHACSFVHARPQPRRVWQMGVHVMALLVVFAAAVPGASAASARTCVSGETCTQVSRRMLGLPDPLLPEKPSSDALEALLKSVSSAGGISVKVGPDGSVVSGGIPPIPADVLLKHVAPAADGQSTDAQHAVTMAEGTGLTLDDVGVHVEGGG